MDANTKSSPTSLIGEEEIAAVVAAMRDGDLAGDFTAPRIRAFEAAFARYFSGGYAVATSSGTAALHTALFAMGVRPGDEVIVSAFSCVGSLMSILQRGAVPVFADIEPTTYNMDARALAARVSERTRAIMVVHLFGRPANMDAITKVARQHDLGIIEDCAHSLGSRYQGALTGTLGDVAAFSFFAGKCLSTGEGGMLLARDEAVAKRAALFTHYGQDEPLSPQFVGYNYKMTELTAAIGLEQLKKLDQFVARRKQIVELLRTHLADVDKVALPVDDADSGQPLLFFTLRLTAARSSRDALVTMLRGEGVPVTVHYSRTMNSMFADLCGQAVEECPEAVSAVSGVLNLPIVPTVPDATYLHWAKRIRELSSAI
jgi:perosamine synthetase